MRPIEGYILGVMKRLGLNQSQIAAQIGVNRSEINFILKKGVTPSDKTCIKLAQISGDSPEKVILLAAESRAPKESRAIWHSIIQKLACSIVFILILSASAEATSFSKVPFPIRHLDIMSNWKKRRSRPLTFSLA